MRRLVIVAALLFAAACQSREAKYTNIQQTGGGQSERGKQLFTKYGCNACHKIPGINAPQGMVGPPLDKMAARTTIAGKFPNTPATMVQWIRNPQSLDPMNAMPNLGVTPDDARDMTAYLYTLK